jgi:hypothetical protein
MIFAILQFSRTILAERGDHEPPSPAEEREVRIFYYLLELRHRRAAQASMLTSVVPLALRREVSA